MQKVLSHFTGIYSHRANIFLCGFALTLGGFIYIFLRPAEPVFFNWIKAAGFDQTLDIARSHLPLADKFLPDWFIYSLPNGLWAFAYALLISSIWIENNSWLRFLWMASIPVLVLGYEYLQYPGILPGTFCRSDLLMGLVGMLFGMLIGTTKTNNKNHEKTIE